MLKYIKEGEVKEARLQQELSIHPPPPLVVVDEDEEDSRDEELSHDLKRLLCVRNSSIWKIT